MNDIKSWIKDNLQYSRGLICKKCKREWFEKYEYLDKWQQIHDVTSFLDVLIPTFPQRIWHIINEQSLIKCANPSCSISPKFWSFNEGYLRSCSPSCAQYDPLTQEKIKITNLKKYGHRYGLQNTDVIKKRISTLQEKYGVKNISQADGISDKKQETCSKNYGTNWFLGRQDIKENIIREKYGVNNIRQLPDVVKKGTESRRSIFYDTLLSTNRLNGKCIPAFSKAEYIKNGIEQKYPFECSVCNAIFDGWIHDGDIPRCPICYPLVGSSMFEMEVSEYIQSILGNEILIENNRRNILSNNKELDIYIPSKNIAIECDGLFWHGEIGGNKNRNYHLNKTIECERMGIRLIHIFEDEWGYNKNIIKSKLKNICDKTSTVIYARKCSVSKVSPFSKKDFLDINHVQGNDNSIIYYGLEFENKLVAIMTFSKKRRFIGYKNDNLNDEYELCRYTTTLNCNIVGGASKLLSYFIKYHNPKKIISYADKRWTGNNNMYEKIGFKKVSNGTPNYWYFGRGQNYNRHHRFGFAKHTLSRRLKSFDPNISEWENMKNNGWDRIWDCGNLKYEMSF